MEWKGRGWRGCYFSCLDWIFRVYLGDLGYVWMDGNRGNGKEGNGLHC